MTAQAKIKPKPTTSDRPEILEGATRKVVISTEEGRTVLYVTLNLKDDQPVEVFINCTQAQVYDHMSMAMLNLSRALQRGSTIEEECENLAEIHSPVSSHWHKGKYYVSIYARIADELLSIYKELK